MAGPIDTGWLVRGLAALEDAVSALRDQLAATTARADRLDLLVETERGRIVTIEAKAVAAEQGRDRAEAQAAELRALLEQAEAAAEKARREAVHEARQAAQAFDAQGLLARLRAAWRGE
jgi:chromosome segregation ATPase